MAFNDAFNLFNLDDAKLYPITADSAAAYTVGNGIDIPGIRSISFSPEFLTKEQTGDAVVLDVYSKFRKASGTVDHALISLPMLAALAGGTASDSGTTPNQQSKFVWSGTDVPAYCRLEAQVKYVGADDSITSGDFHLIVYKMKLSNLKVELQNEDFAAVSFDYEAIPCKYDSKCVEMQKNETAVALTSTADTTPPTVSSSTPADGAPAVAIASTVAFVFSEEMMLSTMDASTFFIAKDDGTSVAFTASYSQATKTMTLTPAAPLANSSDYIAGVTTGARDLAGNRLAAQHVINFTTVGP
jgi:hypothetical protein